MNKLGQAVEAVRGEIFALVRSGTLHKDIVILANKSTLERIRIFFLPHRDDDEWYEEFIEGLSRGVVMLTLYGMPCELDNSLNDDVIRVIDKSKIEGEIMSKITKKEGAVTVKLINADVWMYNRLYSVGDVFVADASFAEIKQAIENLLRIKLDVYFQDDDTWMLAQTTRNDNGDELHRYDINITEVPLLKALGVAHKINELLSDEGES